MASDGTIRSISAILTLLADNTTGAISPQDIRDAVVSLEAISPDFPLHYSATVQGVGSGDFYVSGYFDAPAADSNLTNAGPTQTYGTASGSYAAHAFVVAAAAGVTDGSSLVLTATGTSITDAGVRTTSDSETLVAVCTTSTTNQYYETTKKWLGTVTFTLSSAGGTTFNYDFNYGYVAYNDWDNKDFKLKSLNAEWYAGANDTGFDIHIYAHNATGWTYHATAFVPGNTPIQSISNEHSTDNNLVNNRYGRWKKTGLSNSIAGSGSEGLIVHIVTTVNNSVEWINVSLHIAPDV